MAEQKNNYTFFLEKFDKKDQQLKLEQLKNDAPEMLALLDYNYQAMCAIKLVNEDRTVEKMLKHTMKKTCRVIKKYKEGYGS